jgi:hypothetical protein
MQAYFIYATFWELAVKGAFTKMGEDPIAEMLHIKYTSGNG